MSLSLYVAEIDSQACNFDFLINGVPLERELLGQVVTVQYPANHLLKSGINDIKVNIFPRPGEVNISEGASFSYKIYKQQDGTSIDERVVIHSDALPPYDEKKILPFHSLHYKINDLFPFPVPSFIDAEKIEDKTLRKDLVLGFFEQLHSLFAKKNLQAVANLFSVRDREIAQAFYMNPEENVEDTYKMLESDLHDRNLKLNPFLKEAAIVESFADNTVFTCYNAALNSPISYMDEDGSLTNYPVYICIPSGKKDFIVVR